MRGNNRLYVFCISVFLNKLCVASRKVFARDEEGFLKGEAEIEQSSPHFHFIK